MSKMYDVFPSFPSLNASTSTAATAANSAAAAFHRLLPPPLEPFFFLSYPSFPSTSASSRALRLATPPTVPAAVPILYGKGPADACFVITTALTLTIAREITMRYILAGFARWYLSPGASSNSRSSSPGSKGAISPSASPMSKAKRERQRRKMEHAVSRFSEQGWSFLYCTCMWSLGAVSDFDIFWLWRHMGA